MRQGKERDLVIFSCTTPEDRYTICGQMAAMVFCNA